MWPLFWFFPSSPSLRKLVRPDQKMQECFFNKLWHGQRADIHLNTFDEEHTCMNICNSTKKREISTSKKLRVFTYGQETSLHTPSHTEIHSLCRFMLFWCCIRSKQPVNHALNKAHHVQWLKVCKISLSQSLHYGDLISIGCALTVSRRCSVFTDNSSFPQPSELPCWILSTLAAVFYANIETGNENR